MAFPTARKYMVPMRDGVRLATDVRPGKGRGPWPVLLSRTPYGRKMGAPDAQPTYVKVSQDVRGRFDSEGSARPFFDDAWGERQDGYDTVQWILKQPWCDGKIGSLGGSALGMTQQMLAGANPPGLVCQHIWVACPSIYHRFAYWGGVFQESLFGGWIEKAEWPPEVLDLVHEHPFYDELWQGVDAAARLPQQGIDIPAVHCGGWFDMYAHATIEGFLSRCQVSQNQWLIMGPWPHGTQREVGEVVFPENAMNVPSPGHDVEVWFDYWLKGKRNGMPKIPRVQYYTMGALGEKGAPGNKWRSADSWPPPGAVETRLFLSADGGLTRRPPADNSLTYDHDPLNPVPTRGGGNMFIPAGPMDQSELEARADVLVFSTPPLKEPIEVSGPVIVHLRASCSEADTTLVAKLCDVYPDGRSMLITDGALRGACRDSLSDPSPLNPGQIYEFRVHLGSTSMIFNRGHRIRIAVASSNYPRYAAYPKLGARRRPRVAQMTVYCGSEYPSAVILPVVGA